MLIQKRANEALQESAEMFLVQTFEDALLLTEHRRRVTVNAQDMQLVQRIQTTGFRYQSANQTNAAVLNDENDQSE